MALPSVDPCFIQFYALYNFTLYTILSSKLGAATKCSHFKSCQRRGSNLKCNIHISGIRSEENGFHVGPKFQLICNTMQKMGFWVIGILRTRFSDDQPSWCIYLPFIQITALIGSSISSVQNL